LIPLANWRERARIDAKLNESFAVDLIPGDARPEF